MTESIDKTEDKGDMDPRLENLAGYVLGALDSDAERAAVETLIETDSEAQTEFNELSEATNLLAIAVPAVAPPAHLKATILAMAAEDATPSPVEPTPITTEPSKSWWTKLVQTTYAPAAAAAVLALIVAGGLSFQSN